MEKIFDRLKVVELASVLAGPSVGMFFAELGATVLKVENAQSNGDVSRSWKLASEDSNHPFSAYYSSVNWGKESVFWNLTDEADFEKLKTTLQTADVVLINYKAGDAEKFGLDYSAIKKIQPNIIYGEISGFSDSNRIAYDVVLQAESGFMYMNGSQNENPLKMPVAFIDLFAAHQLKEGILLALLQQQKKKQAIKVSVSLYDAALSALANQATNWLMGKHIPQPIGSLHPNIAPYGEWFLTKDNKKIVLAVGNEGQFNRLCKLLSIEALITDQRYNQNQNRVKNREALAKIIGNEIAKWNRETLLDQMIASNIPAGAIRNMKEVFEQDSAKQQLIEEEKEGKLLKTVKGNAFKLTFG